MPNLNVARTIKKEEDSQVRNSGSGVFEPPTYFLFQAKKDQGKKGGKKEKEKKERKERPGLIQTMGSVWAEVGFNTVLHLSREWEVQEQVSEDEVEEEEATPGSRREAWPDHGWRQG